MINGFKTKIITHKNFGEKLRQARTRKNLTIEDAEEKTQVRLRYLQAFEDNNFDCLPDEVYAIGFLKRYLCYLNLPVDKYLAEFKRNQGAWKSMNRLSLKPKISQSGPRFIITPRLLLGLAGVLSVLILTTYIWSQVHHLTAPPQLQISSPRGYSKVALQNIEVSGNTDPEATVSINNQPVNQDANGRFKQSIALENGINTIHIVATNRFEKENSQTLTIVKANKGASDAS
jgi:cytoskeletal protein RodZ